MNKPVKCFIVEGEDRDLRFVDKMAEVFFKGKYETVTLILPASENIYMLYQELQSNLFEIDLIELLRDKEPEIAEKLEGIERQQIDEVFLFFDYDIHQHNLPEDQDDPLVKLDTMLRFFDNETENGKLYINYPMVEALYDYQDGMCEAFTGCYYSADQLNRYKEVCGRNNPYASSHFGRHDNWRMVLSIFGLKIRCLFDLDDLTYECFKDTVTPHRIYMKQRKILNDQNAVFVLSAFPEFLLDYYKADFWNTYITRRKLHYTSCPKQPGKNRDIG